MAMFGDHIQNSNYKQKAMKKSLLNWMAIFVVAIVSVGFVSCSDDDDKNDNNNNNEEQSSSSIIGTWRNDWGSGARSYTAYSFFEDGTGLMFDKGNGAQRFTYTYNSHPQSVNIVYSEYDKENMAISKLTSSVLVMDGDEYKKVELTYDMLILGEWLLHVNVQNSDEEHKTVVTFWADGKYEAEDYVGWYYGNSLGDLQGTYNGTWSITDKRLSIKGSSQIAGEYIIEGLVVNGCRLVRASNPDEYPYLLGGWHQR